uniref:SAM domain-containing protein n=1 Tax=Cacopsylla melanoneura TaxID=428564 RepID=A0A8D8YE81_9HEMI
MNPVDTPKPLHGLEERASGESRKWKAFTVEPNAVIQSTLEFCNQTQYLDLIMKYTKNKKEVFLSLGKSDLKDIGISNEDHCSQIEEGIHFIGGKRPERIPVTLNKDEATQILKNINENLTNISLGMKLYLNELLDKKPRNFFVSQYDGRTAGHDALEFIRTTKHVYANLVRYLHETNTLSDKEFKAIMYNLNKAPPSKLKKKKMKIFALTFTLGSVCAIGWLLMSQSS